MPGYFVHIVAAPDEIRKTKLGLLGLIAPDLWKRQKPYKADYEEIFKGCKKAPSYEEINILCDPEHGGTHFGNTFRDTSSANFALIDQLFEDGLLDRNNSFIKGFYHHLKVDKTFYNDESIYNMDTFKQDFAIYSEKAVSMLHSDWDKTNKIVSEWYPEVLPSIGNLPKEVSEVIGFLEGTPRYINLERLHDFIERMREETTPL